MLRFKRALMIILSITLLASVLTGGGMSMKVTAKTSRGKLLHETNRAFVGKDLYYIAMDKEYREHFYRKTSSGITRLKKNTSAGFLVSGSNIYLGKGRRILVYNIKNKRFKKIGIGAKKGFTVDGIVAKLGDYLYVENSGYLNVFSLKKKKVVRSIFHTHTHSLGIDKCGGRLVAHIMSGDGTRWVYVMDKDGKHAKCIGLDPSIPAKGSTFYYLDDTKGSRKSVLFSKNIKTGKKKALSNDLGSIFVWWFQKVGKRFFYQSLMNEGLYQIRGKKISLLDKITGVSTVFGKNLFYTKGDNCDLYRYNISSGKKTRLASGKIDTVFVNSKGVFFEKEFGSKKYLAIVNSSGREKKLTPLYTDFWRLPIKTIRKYSSFFLNYDQRMEG